MMETCVDPIAALGPTIGQDAASRLSSPRSGKYIDELLLAGVEGSSTEISQEPDSISDMTAHSASDQDHAGRFESRHTSFKFQANKDGQSGRGPSFEGVNASGDALKILRLK